MGIQNEPTVKGRLTVSLIFVLIALLSAVAATTAWFSIADRTKVQSLDMQVTTGNSLRFDLDPHEDFYDYTKTLTFADVKTRITQDLGFDLEAVPLEPVTTSDCVTFTFGDDKAIDPKTGVYLTFTLNFMAQHDMFVHLTSANSKDAADGTMITSKTEHLPEAMRISFSIGDTSMIYDPGIGNSTYLTEDGVKVFGLNDAANMVYTDDNTLFAIKEGENLLFLQHIWIEGNHEQCTDALREADYQIRMRFMGTDENGVPLE